MLNRRSFLGGLCASLPIIAPPGSSSARTARPRLHAMIVGIDTYPGLGRRNQLRGCINDARDIARAVRPLAATIRMLGFTAASGVEQAVDRDFFFSTWQAMAAEARDGDTLLLTFSGHGGQVPDLNGDEADGKDETLILSAFNTGPPGSVTQHIVDDELAVLFAGAHARRLAVVFVADCCYSGTVYRRVELDDVRHRTIRSYQPLPDARSVVTRQLGASESPPNLVFLGASQEDEAAPEINIDGEWRGALSVAVAQALRGGAVRDGVITGYSLTRSVLRTVNALSDSGQHPTVIWGGPRARPADTMTLDPRRPLIVLGPAPAPPAVSAATDGPVRLRIRGLAAGERPPSLTNALVVGEAEPASLIWDAGRRLVFNDRGNRIAEGVDARRLQHAVDRQRALESIIRMSAGDGLNVEVLLPGQTAPTVTSDATHTPGTMLTIRIGRVEDGRNSGCIETGHYFAVFNVTGSGKVQMLWPTPYRQPDPRHANFAGPDFTDGRRKAGSDPERIGHVQVRQPFGADHVVAVAGALPLGRLMPALVEGHEQFGSLRAIEALALEARAQPLQVGFKGIYTSRG